MNGDSASASLAETSERYVPLFATVKLCVVWDNVKKS